MLLLLIKQYWLEFGLVLIGSLFIAYIHSLNSQIEKLENEKRTALMTVELQNALIVSNRADYELQLKRLPIVLKSIDTKYKNTVQTIYEWKESNVSNDCNGSIEFLNTHQF